MILHPLTKSLTFPRQILNPILLIPIWHETVDGVGPHWPVSVLHMNCPLNPLAKAPPPLHANDCVLPPVEEIVSPAVFVIAVAGQA